MEGRGHNEGKMSLEEVWSQDVGEKKTNSGFQEYGLVQRPPLVFGDHVSGLWVRRGGG